MRQPSKMVWPAQKPLTRATIMGRPMSRGGGEIISRGWEGEAEVPCRFATFCDRGGGGQSNRDEFDIIIQDVAKERVNGSRDTWG